MWIPKTLLDAINSGESVSVDQDRAGRYKCPNCGVGRPAAAIVDVRHLPIEEEFCCDCCWTTWEREERSIDGGPVTRTEWRERWAKALNAPPEVVEKISSASRRRAGL